MSITMSSDVAEHLGRDLTPAESTRAGVLIAGTEIQIRAHFGSLDILANDTLVWVTAEAVRAALLRPDDGSVTTSVQIDDGLVTKGYGSTTGTNSVQILPEWWDMLTPTDGAHSVAFSIAPC